MYIDRIRIDWDKVSPDSYLTRIPAIGLLQELAFRKPVTFFVGVRTVPGSRRCWRPSRSPTGSIPRAGR